MRAGRLRQRVTIQEKTESQNAYGESAPSLSAAGTVWAEVRPMMAQARERTANEAQKLLARAPYQVRLRYLSGLSPVSHHFLWGSRTLEIEAVTDPDGRRHEMVCMCFEVQGVGNVTIP